MPPLIDMLTLAHQYAYHLYDDAPLGYVTLSSAGTIRHANLRFARWVTAERQALIGQPFHELLCPETHPVLDALLTQPVQKTVPLSIDLSLRSTQHMDIRYVRAQAYFAHDVASAPDVLLVLSDITALKAAQNELRLAFKKFFSYWRI